MERRRLACFFPHSRFFFFLAARPTGRRTVRAVVVVVFVVFVFVFVFVAVVVVVFG